MSAHGGLNGSTHSHLLGPRPTVEVILTWYDNGQLAYQFHSSPEQLGPAEIRRLLLNFCHVLTHVTEAKPAARPPLLPPVRRQEAVHV